jgi:hypothetical protein
MSRRFAFGALMVLVPGSLSAQAQIQPAAAVRPQTTAQAPPNALASVCDGSEIRRLERRRYLGDALMLGGLVGGFAGLSATHRNPAGAITAVAAGATLSFAGLFVKSSAYPSESFWQRTLARMHVGETTRAQVETCLHAPSGVSASGTEEEWTYFARAPLGPEFHGGSVNTVKFTFKDGVLSDIRRTEISF